MEPQRFNTKTAYCFVLPDKLVLSSGSDYTKAEGSSGNKIKLLLLIYAAVACYLYYSGIQFLLSHSFGSGGIRLLVAVYLTIVIFRSRNNSSAAVIYKNSIKNISYQQARHGLRSYFSVLFTDASGHEKKRLILLPGSLCGGKEAAEEALIVMRNSGYYVTD